MKRSHSSGIFLTLLLALLLFPCDGSGTMVADGGGIGDSGIVSQGTITGFGSIWVNGTEFDTADALVIVQGQKMGIGDNAVLENLSIGKVVTVEAALSDHRAVAVANQVTYNLGVKGPVGKINSGGPAIKAVEVLGQTILIDARTQLKGTTLDRLARNDVVEVSGLFDDKGAIQATFLEKTGQFSAGLRVAVIGVVQDLNVNLETFRINKLTVDYAEATREEVPKGRLKNGMAVEA